MARICWLMALAALACASEGSRNVTWVTVPTRADHAKFFPVAAGSHAVECNACHGTGSSFQQFDCVSCHGGTLKQDLDVIHARVSGPAPGFQPVPTPMTPDYSRTCLACHAAGLVDPTIAGQNHAGLFPIGAGDSHAYGKTVTVGGAQIVNGCGTCHVDVANRANVDCTVCHVQAGNNGVPSPTVPADQGTAHSGKVGTTGANGAPDNPWLGTGPVGTGSGASAQCIKCHGGDARPGGYVVTHAQAGPAHVVFPVDSSNTSHFVSCDQCHSATLTPAGRKNPELDFSQASCDKCHQASGTNSVVAAHGGFGSPIPGSYSAGDANNSSACLGCHPSGGSASGFSHVWFPIGASDAHRGSIAKCGDCHSDPASYQGDPAMKLSLITCTGRCHTDAVAVHTTPKVSVNIWEIPGPPGYEYTNNPRCLDCHAGNIGGSVAAWSTPLVFRLAQHDMHCTAGPSIANAGGDRTHSVNRNADNGINTCFACHDATMNTGGTPWARNWAVAAGCPACHQHRAGTAGRSCR